MLIILIYAKVPKRTSKNGSRLSHFLEKQCSSRCTGRTSSFVLTNQTVRIKYGRSTRIVGNTTTSQGKNYLVLFGKAMRISDPIDYPSQLLLFPQIFTPCSYRKIWNNSCNCLYYSDSLFLLCNDLHPPQNLDDRTRLSGENFNCINQA